MIFYPIISADTIIVLKKNLIAKPKSKNQNIKILNDFSGLTHQIITAIVVCWQNIVISKLVITKISFKQLSKEKILFYLNMYDWKNSTYGYNIQTNANILVNYIDNNYTNTLGLPVNELIKLLKKIGYLKY